MTQVRGGRCKTLQGLPAWARGVFSIRFGGSEFKAPAHANGQATTATGHAAATINGHAATANGAALQQNGKAGAGSRLPTFTGSASEVYGNSSRETGWTAEQHAGAGLPASWAEHPAGAVLWMTGGVLTFVLLTTLQAAGVLLLKLQVLCQKQEGCSMMCLHTCACMSGPLHLHAWYVIPDAHCIGTLQGSMRVPWRPAARRSCRKGWLPCWRLSLPYPALGTCRRRG